MKKSAFNLIIFLLCAKSSFGQSKSPVQQRINLLGVGYGIEYSFTSRFSLIGEIGFSPWEKLGAQIEDKEHYDDMCQINPYTIASLRYYFNIPSQDQPTQVLWYGAATYSGLYTAEKFMELNGSGRYQTGIFGGIKVLFGKLWYFELELGPGYQQNDWKDGGFNLYGNGGLGLRIN